MKQSIAERIATEPALQALLSSARQRQLRKQQIVFEEGSKAESLFLILSGSVVMTARSGGHELLLGYKYTGEFFGEMGMFPDVAPQRSARIAARGPCTVLELGYDRFRGLVHAYPELWAEIAQQLARDLRAVNRRLAEMPTLHAADRIWQVLLELASHEGRTDQQDRVEVRVTRRDLGQLAGCSREVAGLVLRDLSRAGKLELRGHAIRLRV